MRVLKFKTYIELKGEEVRVSVIGDYYPRFAGTYYEPAHPHSVEDLVVEHEGNDITESLNKAQLEYLREFFLIEAMEIDSWKK